MGGTTIRQLVVAQRHTRLLFNPNPTLGRSPPNPGLRGPADHTPLERRGPRKGGQSKSSSLNFVSSGYVSAQLDKRGTPDAATPRSVRSIALGRAKAYAHIQPETRTVVTHRTPPDPTMWFYPASVHSPRQPRSSCSLRSPASVRLHSVETRDDSIRWKAARAG